MNPSRFLPWLQWPVNNCLLCGLPFLMSLFECWLGRCYLEFWPHSLRHQSALASLLGINANSGHLLLAATQGSEACPSSRFALSFFKHWGKQNDEKYRRICTNENLETENICNTLRINVMMIPAFPVSSFLFLEWIRKHQYGSLEP